MTKEIRLHVSLAWWLKWWLYGLMTAAILSGAKPDQAKVTRMILKAIRIRYV
ncbi:hypothetical protein [Xenophilus sp.]|uniref:hypothetical protein n=1 Tax=Xenophilus sp. TaxID=1873499 RepID=UPI0037DC2ECC